MRLLVADDARDITKAVKAMLEHSGYAVDTVDNGGDALSCGGGRATRRTCCASAA